MSVARARSVAAAIAAAALCSAAPDAAAQGFPVAGTAPGSQTASADPFTGLARSPEADLFTGTASASITIEVPRGRANMTPRLSLDYASTGEPGPVGHGWSLGVGRITRSLKHGVPAYDDALDAFVLELPGAVTELTPVDEDEGLYRPRYQGSHLKIVRVRARNYWKVFDKDGTLYVFGRNPQGRNSRTGPDARRGRTTFAWLLEQIVDPWGNSIDFVYAEGDDSRAYGRLLEVHYGGNTRRAGTWPDLIPHLFRVALAWSLDPGPPALARRTYEAGFATVTDDRLALERISTHYRDEQGIERTARVYELHHEVDPTTLVRRLSAVTLSADGDNGTTIVPATVFEYAPSLQVGYPLGPTVERRPSALVFPSPGAVHDRGDTIRFDTFDIDADGLVDYVDHALGVRFGTGDDAGFEPQWTPWAWPAGHPHVRRINDDVNILENVFDVDGDALPDFVDATTSLCDGRCPACDHNCWDVYLNTGAGFAADPLPWPAPSPLIRDSGTSGAIHRDTIDMNGDGLPDFVDAKNARPGFWDVYRNTGAGFDLTAPARWEVPAVGARISHAQRSDQTTFTWSGLVDMNGDGLPDLLSTLPAYPSTGSPGFAHTDRWVVHYNNGSGFEAPVDWRVEGAAPGQRWLLSHHRRDKSGTTAKTFSDLIDMTGDGLPDLVRRFESSDRGLPRPPCPAAAPGCASALLFVNTGSSFAQPVALPAWDDEQTLRSWDDGASPAAGREFDLFDFDGDGLIDLVERAGDEWHVYRHPASPYANGSSTPPGLRYKPDLLVSMMNGVGGETFLEYSAATLLAEGRCVRDAASGPVAGRCLPFPHWVVTARTHADPSSPVPAVETSHAYSHPRYSAVDREFRGFAAVWTVARSGRAEVRTFHQDAARKGLVQAFDELGKPDCRPADPDDAEDPCSPWSFVLSSTTNVWGEDPVALLGTTTVPYKRLDGRSAPVRSLARTTEHAYDGYGNEIKKTITGSGHSYVVESTYDASDSRREYIVNKPAATWGYSEGGPRLFYQTFRYKRGSLTRSETCRVIEGAACMRWSKVKFKLWKPTGQVRKTKAPGRGVTKLRYDDDFVALAEERDPVGLITRYTYDRRAGARRRVEHADGRVREIDHDGLGRPVAVRSLSSDGVLFTEASAEYVDPTPTLGILGRTRVDVIGRAPRVVFSDGLGRTIAVKTLVDATALGTRAVVSGLKSYDDSGRISAEAAPFESDDADVTSLSARFADTAPAERTVHQYDDRTGRLMRTVYPDASSMRFERRVPGFNLVVDANLSRQLGGDDAAVACDEALGTAEIEYLDALGRTTRRDQCAKAPDVSAVEAGGDACPASCLLARTDYEYDALDRLVSVTTRAGESDGADATARYQYDGAGNRILVDDDDSGRWVSTYTAAGRVRRQTDPAGRTLSYSYDEAGRIVTRSASGLETSYAYHGAGAGAGKVESITTRAGGSLRSRRTLHYDLRGLPDRETLEIRTPTQRGVERSAWTFDRSYDLAGRLVATTYPAAGGFETLTTTYSAFGRPVRLASPARVYVESVEYDIHDRIIAIEHGNGLTDVYGYAPAAELGRLRCVRTGPGAATGGGDPCSARAGDLSAVAVAQRDAAGRIAQITDLLTPIGVARSASRAFTYDALGRLLAAVYADGTEDVYAYDSVGNITARNGASYRYDAVSGHPHRLVQVGTTLLGHDASGSRTRKGSAAYSYDGLGRLARVSDDGVERVRYFYDDSPNRVARHELSNDRLVHYYNGQFEVDVHAGQITRHFYLGDRQIASDRILAPIEVVEAAVPTPPRTLLPSSGAGARIPPDAPAPLAPVALHHARLAGLAIVIGLLVLTADRRRRAALLCVVVYTNALVLPAPARARAADALAATAAPASAIGTGATVFYHLDHVGSPRLITDASGAAVEHLLYRAYGELRAAFDANGALLGHGYEHATTELGFTGAQVETTAGLVDFGSRFYDPEVALFLTIDPAEQFASPYAYASFDPVNLFDPDGRFLPLLLGATLVTKSALSATIAGAATLIDTLVRSGDLGAALQAGVIAGASGIAFGAAARGLLAAGGTLNTLDSGRAALLRAASAGFGAAQSFREGNLARGLASLYSGISGLRPGDVETSVEAQRGGVDTEPDGMPVASADAAGFGQPLPSAAGEPLDHELWLAARSTERDGKIGHALVALGQTDGELEVYGFYPAEPVNFKLPGALRTVDGAVIEGVDANSLARAVRGAPGHAAVKYAITRSGFEAAVAEITRYRGLSYNAARCNCTSFALDVTRAAGVNPPFGGIVPRPAVLHRSIRRLRGR